MPRPTKVCDPCNGDGKFQEYFFVDEENTDLYYGEWIDCGECDGSGRVPISDAELLDLIWERVQNIERKWEQD